jgi:hypothetical protein
MKNHQEPLFDTVTDEYKRALENIPIADAFLGPIMHDILSTNDPSVPHASVPRAASAAAASLSGASASYATAALLPAAAASINHQHQVEKDAAYARSLQSMYEADPDRIIDVDSETMDERKPAAKSNSPINLVDSDSGVTPPPARQVYHPINTNTTVSSSLPGIVAPVTKALSARDKEAIRGNNARESLNIIKK